MAFALTRDPETDVPLLPLREGAEYEYLWKCASEYLREDTVEADAGLFVLLSPLTLSVRPALRLPLLPLPLTRPPNRLSKNESFALPYIPRTAPDIM